MELFMIEQMNVEERAQLREQLADQEHERWSRWMTYLFSKCKVAEGGNLLIPHESVKHWLRQIETPYSELSEEEKDSDKKEADNTLRLLEDYSEAIESLMEVDGE
jgi:hypothetical protein